MLDVSFIGAITDVIDTIGDTLALFTKEPTVYFTAAAFTAVALGLARKLVPMRKR